MTTTSWSKVWRLARMFEPFAHRVVVLEVSTNQPGDLPVDIALVDTFAQHLTSPRWAALARRVVTRPWWVIAGTTIVLLAMTAPLLDLRLGSPTAADTYGQGSAPGRAAAAITDAGLSPSLLRPTQVLTTAADATGVAKRLYEVPAY